MAAKDGERTAEDGIMEEDIINFYVEAYLEDVKMAADDAKKELTDRIREHKHGKGSTRPFRIADWGKLLNENACPSCGAMMSLGETSYGCAACGLEIPAGLYDRAKRQHEEELRLVGKRREFSQRIGKSGLSEKQIGELYNRALDIAESRLPGGGDEKK